MIPLKDENPTRTTPYITYLIIVLNIITFAINGPLRAHGNRLGELVLIPRVLFHGGVTGGPLHIPVWASIITYQFMHASFLHIAGNMLFLWIFGNNIEDVLGHVKYLIFYLLCGIAAAAAQVLPMPDSPAVMLGASGSIAGVLGAYMLLFPKARVATLLLLFPFIQVIYLPASIFLGIWIGLQVLNSFIGHGGGVAYLAHIGGFLAGLAMISIFGGRRLLGGRRAVEYTNNGWNR